jgi:predicted O-methyltransferase YrrM
MRSGTDLLLATLLVVSAILAAIAVLQETRVRRYKRYRREEGLGRPWKIRRVPLKDFDPAFAGDLQTALAGEVAMVTHDSVAFAGTSDREAYVLAVLSKRAHTMFEFGTCTGRTTYLWARNSPPDAIVTTLTLRPDEVERAYTPDQRDDPSDTTFAHVQSRYDRFLYSDSTVEHKVVQLYGDSKELDITPYLDACDLIFVDGSHAYSYVANDSDKALRMVKPGGIIIWHDYRGPTRVGGVYRRLNELATHLPLVHLFGTSLVAYRRPTP